jgi:hypothetical protein
MIWDADNFCAEWPIFRAFVAEEIDPLFTLPQRKLKLVIVAEAKRSYTLVVHDQYLNLRVVLVEVDNQ